MRLDAAAYAAAEELKLTTPERHVELKLDAVELDADPDRLAQVASNLIGNALKHSPMGAKVTVRVAREDGAAVLEVMNEGPPIPPERLQHIFEPFVLYGDASSGSGQPMRDGLGLGLYISKEIVQAHGGRLDVESTAARGTRFTVRLPVWAT
jgi:signal transduction histidine kinase